MSFCSLYFTPTHYADFLKIAKLLSVVLIFFYIYEKVDLKEIEIKPYIDTSIYHSGNT